MLSNSRRELVTTAQTGGCFSSRMSLTDFHAVSPLPSCPQGVLELSDKIPLPSGKIRSYWAAVTLPDDLSWSNFLATLLDFSPE